MKYLPDLDVTSFITQGYIYASNPLNDWLRSPTGWPITLHETTTTLRIFVIAKIMFDDIIPGEGGRYSHTWPDGMCRSTGCPFAVKIMRQGIVIGKKICDRVSCRKENYAIGYHQQKLCFYSVCETWNFHATGYTFGPFLCDMVQGVETFSIYPRYFPSQVPPPPVIYCLYSLHRSVIQYWMARQTLIHCLAILTLWYWNIYPG